MSTVTPSFAPSLLDLRGQPLVCEWVEPVEERLDDERLGDEVEDSRENEERRGCEPPRTAEPGRETERDRRGGGDEQALNADGDRLVAEPAGGALIGQPVPPAPPERDRPDGHGREPERDHDRDRDEDSGADPPAPDSAERLREGPRLPDEQAHDDELNRERSGAESATQMAVVVRASELRGAEIVAGIEIGNVEARHARPPEEEARDDPHRGKRDQARGLR